MSKNPSETQERTINERVIRIYNFILSHQNRILILGFFIALMLPLIAESIYGYIFLVPQTSTRTILEILDSSVNKWVDAFFRFSNDLTTDNDLLGFSLVLVESGVDRLHNFVGDMTFFYQQIFQTNFTVINQTGYILTGIFFVIPIGIGLCICWMCIKLIKQPSSTRKSIKNVLLQLTAPRNLFILLLVFPFPQKTIWLAAIFVLFILIYYLIIKLNDWRKDELRQNLFFAISWKKAFLFSIFISLVLGTIYGVYSIILVGIKYTSDFNTFLDFLSVQLFGPQNAILASIYSNLTISSILGLKPNLIFILIIIGIILFVVLWIFLNWHTIKESETNKNFARKIIRDYVNTRSIIYLVIVITIFITLFDSLVIQGPIRDLMYILLNLPWFIGLIFFDPLQFFGILITATKVSFDILITSIREIANDIVPTNPNQPSIFGSIQPSLFYTAIIFLIFTILLTLTLILIRRHVIKDEAWRTTLTRHYPLWGLLMPIIVISSFVIFLLEPSNFLTIFGDQHDINTKQRSIGPILGQSFSIEDLLFLGTVFLCILLFIALIVWTYIQIFRMGRSFRVILQTILINSFTILIAIIMIFPFIWMVKNSLQTNLQNIAPVEKQGLIPDPLTIANYAQLFGLIPPGYETLEYRVVTWLFNSLVTAVSVTAFLIIFSAMAGYCLAKKDFIGRRALIAITIGIMFVPPYVQVIPLYLELSRLGFVGSLLGVILPFLIQPFSVFICTEFMRSIPDDYLDAARVDGYSEFQIFWKVVLPLSIPVISVMTIINIIANWNAFMWPLLLLELSRYAPDVRTLPLGMYRINNELQEQAGVILGLATIIVIPIFIILFLAQDYIKRGVTVEGLKG